MYYCIMSSPMELIIKMKDFDASQDIQYRDIRVNKNGQGKNVAIVTGTGNKLVMQVPLSFTWGANEYVDDSSGRRTYHLNFQPEVGSPTFKAMASLEEKIMADAVTNSKKWFGKTMSKEVVEAFFYPILKYPLDKSSGEADRTRQPTLKVKIPYWDERFTMELYGMDNSVIYSKNMENPEEFDIMDELPPKTHISCLIECGGIWFAGGRCGVTWKFIQGKRRKPVKLEGFCMLEDTDDEEMEEALEEQDAAAATTATVPETQPEPEMVVDSPESTTKKPRKKRLVKKGNSSQ